LDNLIDLQDKELHNLYASEKKSAIAKVLIRGLIFGSLMFVGLYFSYLNSRVFVEA
jgi:hypothetical protein